MTTNWTQGWQGQSGVVYQYEVYPLNATFSAVPGNYIFARLEGNQWRPLYIGESQDLSERISNHNEWPCVRRHGVTHIHAHVNNGGQAVRRAEEADLLARFSPPCNG